MNIKASAIFHVSHSQGKHMSEYCPVF